MSNTNMDPNFPQGSMNQPNGIMNQPNGIPNFVPQQNYQNMISANQNMVPANQNMVPANQNQANNATELGQNNMPGNAMPGNAMPSNAMPGNTMPGNNMPGNPNMMLNPNNPQGIPMNAENMQQMVFNNDFQGGNPQYGNQQAMFNMMQGGMNPNFQQGFGGGDSNEKYKTSLCNNFSSTGVCKFGDTCKFAHGVQELRRHGGGGQQNNSNYQPRGGGYQPRGGDQRGRGGFDRGQSSRGRGGFSNNRGGFNSYDGMIDQMSMQDIQQNLMAMNPQQFGNMAGGFNPQMQTQSNGCRYYSQTGTCKF